MSATERSPSAAETATPAAETSTPLVSMVIPVYNSISYLAETLDSMLVQGLSESELEVVMVDDGSNDGSETMMDEYAERHPNFRVIHQAPSGGPASPCNVGAYAARGRYFFVLGSDDVMTPNALRDLAEIAEREGSDIVLGKLSSIGGRRTPGAVFAKTVYNADLVENRIFNTLSAVKLFRTELLHKTGALHPTTLRIGSDQPFVAALYLAAGKISICADRDYVRIRTREDGTNITSTRRTPRDYMDLLELLMPVIVDGTAPGRLRDGVMRRPFRNTLTKIVKPSFLELDADSQRRLADEIREVVGPVYNEVTAAHLDPLPRIKVEVALDGDPDGLRALMAWEKAGGSSRVVHDGDRFSYVLPKELMAQVGDRRIEPPVVTGDVTLTDITCHGSVVEIGITAYAVDCETPASETALRLRNRATGRDVDVVATVERPVELAAGSGNVVRARIDLGEFPLGVWDAYVAQRFGEDEIVNRFGAKKSDSVRHDSLYLFAPDDDEPPLGKVYYTRGPENLSIDIGFTHTKNDLPEASVRGVVRLSDGSELAIVSALRAGGINFVARTVHDGTPGRASIPYFALGNGLFAVVLPRDYMGNGVRRPLIVQSENAEQSVLLLPLAEASTEEPWGSREQRQHGRRTADIFRDLVEDLGVVSRRSARRAGHEVKKLSRRMWNAPGASGRIRH